MTPTALLCGLFASALAFAACGDDEKDATDTSTTPETTAETSTPETTTPETSTPETTTPETTTPETTTPETTDPGETTEGGACTNAADLAVIGNPDTDPSAKASTCGVQSCIANAFAGDFDAFEACVQTCMLNASLPDYMYTVSDACSRCYTLSVRCTAEKCLNICAPNPGGPDCAACRENEGCTPDFFTCSGLEP